MFWHNNCTFVSNCEQLQTAQVFLQSKALKQYSIKAALTHYERLNFFCIMHLLCYLIFISWKFRLNKLYSTFYINFNFYFLEI